MKLIIFMSVAALSVMAVMIGQAVRQELNRKHFRNSARDKAIEISKKEDTVAELKKVLQGIKPKLQSMLTLNEELRKKKDDLQVEKNTVEENLNTCNKERGEAENSKSEIKQSFSKQSDAHGEAKNSAQKTIEGLKQQILDREKAICELVDTTNAEARKLCGLGEPA